MKTRTIAILALIFIGLLLAYFIAERPGTDIYEQSADSAGPVFPDLKLSKVRSIEITTERNSVTLKKTESGWIVDDPEKFPADGDTIETILQNVAAMNYSEIASENKDNHAVFEVDDEKGAKVRLLDEKGEPIAAFFSGKNGPNPEMCYVREDGSNVVALQSGLHRYNLDKATASWKDRTIFNFDAGKVAVLEIDRVVMSEVEAGETAEVVGRVRLAFRKTDGEWNMTEPEIRPGKKTALDNIITLLSNQKSAAVPDQTIENTGLDNPSIIINVAMEDGTIHTLLVGNENPSRQNEFLAGNSAKPYLYSITSFQVNKFMESMEDLTMEPEPAEAQESGGTFETDGLQPPPTSEIE